METNELKFFKIGQLSDLVEMSPRTIRYYEEVGLLNSIRRIEGGKRVYTDRDIQRLKFIKRLKHLGLTLSEMIELEDIYQIHRTNRKVLPRLLELLDTHMGKIDERVNNLVRLKAEISNYQENIRQKLNHEDIPQKGDDFHEGSGDHQHGPNSYR